MMLPRRVRLVKSCASATEFDYLMLMMVVLSCLAVVDDASVIGFAGVIVLLVSRFFGSSGIVL